MSAAAKTQRFPFIFNMIPCGSSAAVVAIGSGNNHRRLLSIVFFFSFGLYMWDFTLKLRSVQSATSRCCCQSCLPAIGHQHNHRILHNETSHNESESVPQTDVSSPTCWMAFPASTALPPLLLADVWVVGHLKQIALWLVGHLPHSQPTPSAITWRAFISLSSSSCEEAATHSYMCFLFNLCGWVLILNCLRRRHEFCIRRLGYGKPLKNDIKHLVGCHSVLVYTQDLQVLHGCTLV